LLFFENEYNVNRLRMEVERLSSQRKTQQKKQQVIVFKEFFFINTELDILNGTILKGSKIRASCINEINLLPYNPTTNKTERIETKEPELPNYLNGRLQFEKKPEISQVTNQDEEEKPSILSRIKKHKY